MNDSSMLAQGISAGFLLAFVAVTFVAANWAHYKEHWRRFGDAVRDERPRHLP